MNMTSTGAFLTEMDAQQTAFIDEKFAAVWEKKMRKQRVQVAFSYGPVLGPAVATMIPLQQLPLTQQLLRTQLL